MYDYVSEAIPIVISGEGIGCGQVIEVRGGEYEIGKVLIYVKSEGSGQGVCGCEQNDTRGYLYTDPVVKPGGRTYFPSGVVLKES